MKKIAIVGAGFAGLAAAWHLRMLDPAIQITLFDPQGYGGETSKISAGLLHKYSGLHSKLNPFGIESERATLALLDIVSKTEKHSVILSKGILRLALTEGQRKKFFDCAKKNSDVKWLEPDECHEIDNHLPNCPGILIQSGISINISSYLHGLFTACQEKGIQFITKKVNSTEELSDYDACLFTTGALGASIPELQSLKIHPLKGQLLEMRWPSGLEPLAVSLISQAYLCMTNDFKHVIVGATYEHHFLDAAPDPEFAIKELLPKAIELYPPLADAEVVDVKAGLRASIPSRLPFAGQLSGKIWAFTGLGSRGLLYHAYFAKRLAIQLQTFLKI